MTNLQGQCHCGKVHVIARLSMDPKAVKPRACDCSFCRKQGAAYFSDVNGDIEYRAEPGTKLSKYRQGDEGLVDFLFCPECHVLVGVVYDDRGRLFGAVNASVFDAANFGEPVVVSPAKLSAPGKIARWKTQWSPRIKM